jgi:hypothetical protein
MTSNGNNVTLIALGRLQEVADQENGCAEGGGSQERIHFVGGRSKVCEQRFSG